MPEVRFYHLTDLPLERALPPMLERTLARGLKAVVRGVDPARLSGLDRHLWTFSEESFLPHGADGDAEPARQPVWLTVSDAVPNGALALFLVDGAGAAPAEMAAMEVTAILFDGHDPAAVDAARGQWRAVAAAGLPAVYWAQDDGRWIKRSESPGRA